MKPTTVGALCLLFVPGALFSQSPSTEPGKVFASLEYSDDETQLVVTDSQGNSLIPSDGMALPLGTVVKTLKTTAELKLNPNGTIVKLASATTFRIEDLRQADGTGSNDFALLAGKLRTVAAKLSGTAGPGYNIRTPTANCGVRGTDFAMEYDPATNNDWVCVQEGQVDFTAITTGTTVPVAANQIANTFDPVLSATPLAPEKVADLFSDLGFVQLNPMDVPGHGIPTVAQTKAPEPPAAEAPPEPAPKAPEVVPPAPQPAADHSWADELKKLLGLELGSVTINGVTYSDAVLAPVFSTGNLRLGLYLPILYTTDMFNAGAWYRPSGNNEWSLGTDQTGWQNQWGDFATDLALKIRFLEWGTPEQDPVYLKIGNLDTMTLGYGSIVRNFSNNQEFPVVRKIGLNAGARFGGFQAEALIDDVTSPSVVGGRVGLGLVADQVVLSFESVADLHLANGLDLALHPQLNPNTSYYGDPMLIVGGVDLQLFHLDVGSDFWTAGFVSVDTLASYFQESTSFADQGFDSKTLWRDNQPGSLDGEAGLVGRVSVVDYRFSVQADRGLYTNAIFQDDYYRTRTVFLQQLVQYLNAPDDSTLTLGLFGSAGVDLGDVTLEGSYRWPFAVRASSLTSSSADSLRLALNVPKGKVPGVALSGDLSYERTNFIGSLASPTTLFDANTVFRADLVYGLEENLDVALGVTTSALRDSSGNVIYDAGGKPTMGPTISVETRVAW